ncbi:aldolase/citrate lyase family protein [Winogradskyella sp. SM1960]|uniref:aldolase/citrate lyase family protein n=1 Tax=Winogradskyella sp. SM1960 TaxID=2865955 RepID=UPI001CD1B746|nr:aldolase/citrate lyase family protein [Winogradskyella sp. SM1960]
METKRVFTIGNKGEKVRSDCYISLELKDQGGIVVNLNSKVAPIFGKHIKQLCCEILDYFSVKHAVLNIEDSGALDFVLAARLEGVIKKAKHSDKQFLLKQIPENRSMSNKGRSRVTRLYLPGNTPSLMINSGIHRSDSIILDLEDAVAFHKKQEARFLVRNALRSLNFLGAERMVRINQLPEGLNDLPFIVSHGVNLILIPKCENEEQIALVSERVNEIKEDFSVKYPIWLMPIIESAMGVINLREIVESSEMIVGIAIGLEDYTADVGVKRTQLGMETFFARMEIVTICKAFNIQPIDSVFSDVENLEALKDSVLMSKSLGYEGMGCIHPRQIEVIRKNFAPTEEELQEAKEIVDAYDEAVENGVGVVSLGTKMIDMPVVEKAKSIIEKSIAFHRSFEN